MCFYIEIICILNKYLIEIISLIFFKITCIVNYLCFNVSKLPVLFINYLHVYNYRFVLLLRSLIHLISVSINMETRIYVSFLYQVCICFFIQSFENNTLPNAI